MTKRIVPPTSKVSKENIESDWRQYAANLFLKRLRRVFQKLIKLYVWRTQSAYLSNGCR